jgi:raffinose/stachyose/melibiose transport system substrate-binding protein
MKKATKFAAIALAASLAMTAVTAPAANAAPSCSKPTAITMLGTIKPEIKEQFLNAVKAYNASQKCYKLTTLPDRRPLPFLQVVTPMYAAKKAPTIMYTLQEIPDIASKVMDLTNTPLAKQVPPSLMSAATVGGKIVGVPSTVEAYGLIYNKKVLEAAGVDPKKVATRSDLEAAFKKVEASGKKAVRFSAIYWSLGAHVTNLYFANSAPTHEGRLKVLDGLVAGTKKLASDAVFKNYVATFDLLKKYNSAKTQTIDATGDAEYADAVAELAKGDVGFWFMGNWAEPSLMAKAAAGVDFGLMPVPVSDSAKAYGNNSISVGVPGYFLIDKVQSTPAQREGALDFLTWLYTSAKGQHFVVDNVDKGGMGFIPVYKGTKLEANTFMAKEISTYVKANKAIEWMNALYPAGGFQKYGASSQKYFLDKIDVAAFAAEIEAAWKGETKTWRGAKK